MKREPDPSHDALYDQLKRWGNLQASRFAANEDGPSRGENILHKFKDLAPGTREKAEKALVGRNGAERREYMAEKVGIKNIRRVPMWSCDPVPARNDAGPPRDHPVRKVELMIPDELRWIDPAINALSRAYPLRAAIVTAEFIEPGTHGMKCARVAYRYGGTLTVRQYRYELQLAMVWMDGRRAS